jgi:hypothetical protein
VEAWRELLEAQARSGLTVAEFCRRQGLCSKSFWRVRKALGQAPLGAEPSPFVRIETPGASALAVPASRVRLRLGRCEWELSGLPLAELIQLMEALA